MKEKKFETTAIREQAKRSENSEHSVPIYATSSFLFEDAEDARAQFADEKEGSIYSRYSNPNNDEFIDKLCLLEGLPKGIATSSGMSAMFASIVAFLKQGDHIVASRALFGSTHQIMTKLLPRWGITHTYVDGNEEQDWEAAILPNTKMLFFETPSNPALELLDMEMIGKLGEKHKLIVNVDNCFATPYLQNPADWGAHVVTHSATKFIDGQGRVLGGAVLTTEDLYPDLKYLARHTGPSMSPFHGWLLSKSLETLAVRMDKHSANALHIADRLEGHADINFVRYPFLKSHPQHELAKKQMRKGGGIVTFELSGGIEQGRKFLDNLEMISISANLGDTRTIATHPASTTHSKLSQDERNSVGISDGLVRLSVGLEHEDDILTDVLQAIEKSK
ncbi:MAG: aminotransferase class I/II-fold pyridoxal phosphate-dependent enzyme [Ekhidna sp.]|nr:aminotransferase class I/II-fold pyridoxal phosphate-dependent enzyme [Ekhidna sp.]